MAAISTRLRVLTLYKRLLREGSRFTDYNFRMYTLNKVKYEFRNNKDIGDPSKVQELIREGEENLKMVQRQVLISHLYGEGRLVIESQLGSAGSSHR